MPARRAARLAPLVLAAAIALPFALAASTHHRASAQAATPPAETAADPAACTVAPRPLDDVTAMLAAATPDTRAAAPFEAPGEEPIPIGTPVPVGFVPPPGEPVDAATEAAVAAVARQYVACANADDLLALAALVTDRFLQGSFAAPPDAGQAAGVFVASPQPRPPIARTTLLAAREPRRLPDGRIGVLLDVLDPTNERARGAPSTDFVLLVDQNGRLLIDEYRAGVGTPPPTTATPTA